jgi:CRISPR/Cas system endoribonuclease Cas6 (RAMP superfamily)
MGNMVLEADFGRLKPLLRAGEYVHVGKNTTFGLGKLTISEENSP